MRCLVGIGAIPWAYAFRVPLANFNSRSISATRLYAATNGGTLLTAEELCGKAKDFIGHKNAAGRGDATLNPVFDMCSPGADVYGLTGDEIRPGLTSFFGKHDGLQHELLAEPTQVGPGTVQYPFIKSWKTDDSERQRWYSIDSEKPRDKVERLDFDETGLLVRVAVVEASSPLMPLDITAD